MTEALRPATAECLSCGREFTPRKLGHVFCSSECRYAGPGQRVSRDPEAVKRLFDPERDPPSGSASMIGIRTAGSTNSTYGKWSRPGGT
jgi:hypothetical protein